MSRRASFPIAALILTAALTLPPPCDAQDVSRADPAPAEAFGGVDDGKPRLFDEYGDLRGECDLGARLDNFAIQLQNEPEAKGYIIIYTGRDTLPSRVPRLRARTYDYLINVRGIDAGRLIIMDGGHRDELTNELWIAPKDATAPAPTPAVHVEKVSGLAYKFDEQHLYLEIPESAPRDDPADEAEAEPGITDESFAQDAAKDEVVPQETPAEVSPSDATATEPPPESEQSPEDENLWWAAEDFAQAVLADKGARACVIFYDARDGETFRQARELIERGRKVLIEKYGLGADRVEIIYGGARRQPLVELWVVPASAALPAPSPELDEGPNDGGAAGVDEKVGPAPTPSE